MATASNSNIMSEGVLGREEINSLHRVFQEANKSWLKESRTTESGPLNVLRVLAALRLLYPDSPPALYNAILAITKNSNPQSLAHWRKAAEDLGKRRNLVNRDRRDDALYTKTYQNSFNRSRLQESAIEMQSRSFAQIKLPSGMGLSKQESLADQQKDCSQTNAETGQRQFYTRADSTTQHSKHHYISFQPYSYYHDKENINSTNIGESRRRESAYHYLEAIQRDLSRTGTGQQSFPRTPIDQSFVKNIHTSESPYLSKAQPNEYMDPLEQQMQLRADTVHRFNLQLKGFQSLVANSFVLLKTKQEMLKAKTQHRAIMLHKAFCGLQANVEYCRSERELEERASLHHKLSLQRKSFSLLRFIYQLKRKNRRQIQVEQYSPLCYQFMLNILLSSEERKEEEWLDFAAIADRLVGEDETAKLCQLTRYFGKHDWIAESVLEQFLRNYRLSICRRTFKHLAHQARLNSQFDHKRSERLMKNSFSGLKNYWSKLRVQRKRAMEAQALRNKALLQKVMKALLQTAYSSKLYSKRCEYIQSKNQTRVKADIYSQWVELARSRIIQKQSLQQRIEKSLPTLHKMLLRFAMRSIQLQAEDLNGKMNMVSNKLKQNAGAFLLRQLQTKLQCNNRIAEWLYNRDRQTETRIIQLWRVKTRKSQALNSIFNITAHYYFKKLVEPQLKEALNIYSTIKMGENQMLSKTWRGFKMWFNHLQDQTGHLQAKIVANLEFFRKKSGIESMLQNWKTELLLKARAKHEKLQKRLKDLIIFRKKERFYSKMRKTHAKSTQTYHLIYDMKSALQKCKIKAAIERLRTLHTQKGNSSELTIKLLKMKFQEMVVKLKYNELQVKQQRIENTIKGNVLKQLGVMSKQQRQRQNIKYSKACQHRKESLEIKTMVGLHQLVEKSREVRLVSNKYTERQGKVVAKEFLASWRKHNKLQTIKNRIQKIKCLQKMKSQVFFRKQNKQLMSNIFHQCGKSLLQQMADNLEEKRLKEQRQYKWNLLAKIHVYTQLNLNYSDSLVHRKTLFMVYKFRAMRICKLAFQSWKKCGRPQRNKHKNDRLSTDYIA